MLKRILPVFFFAVILIPGLAGLVGIKGPTTLSENRAAATFPAWEDKTDARSFFSSVDDYLDDNYGFRDTFVYLDGMARARIFKEPSSDRGLIGKDGWWFLLEQNRYALREVCGVHPPSAEKFQEITSAMTASIKVLGDAGIDTRYVIVSRKEQVHFEQLPSNLRKVCAERDSVVDDLIRTANSELKQKIVYPLQPILAKKGDATLYGKHRFHWFDDSLLTSVVRDATLESFGIEHSSLLSSYEGEIASDLGHLFVGLSGNESVTLFGSPEERDGFCSPKDCYDGLSDVHPTGGYSKYWTSLPAKPSDDVKTTRLLNISDSFGPYIAKRFTPDFDSVLQVSLNGIKQGNHQGVVRWMVDDYQPTQVVFLIQASNVKHLGERFVYTDGPSIAPLRLTPEELTALRVSNLETMNQAILNFNSDTGAYPDTEGEWISTYHRKTQAWFSELDDYLDATPVDPRGSRDFKDPTYMYKSDGAGYKLIAHRAYDCPTFEDAGKPKIDPQRSNDEACWGWGYWTPDFEKL